MLNVNNNFSFEFDISEDENDYNLTENMKGKTTTHKLFHGGLDDVIFKL